MKKNSGEILYSKGNNDECYTPAYAVEILKPYLEQFKCKTIWCPFDTSDSQFVQLLKQWGYKVINSHIKYGQNFYTYTPEHFDLIVSNPPFTNKRKIFERCMSFNKPFALLMSVVWLNDKAPKEVFGNELQLLLPDERIYYYDEKGNCMGRPSFSSAYFCRDFLPKDICVCKLNKS